MNSGNFLQTKNFFTHSKGPKAYIQKNKEKVEVFKLAFLLKETWVKTIPKFGELR